MLVGAVRETVEQFETPVLLFLLVCLDREFVADGGAASACKIAPECERGRRFGCRQTWI